jgi:hypothetical protein
MANIGYIIILQQLIDSYYICKWRNLGKCRNSRSPNTYVGLNDKTHSPPDNPFGHAINAVLTGRDKSTGSIYTLFANYTFIEPQTDGINMPLGSRIFQKIVTMSL